MNDIEIIQPLVRGNIRELSPYSTARDEYQGELGVFLDANESPYDNGWNRYPDPHQKLLKDKISQIKGIQSQNLFLGNGSDEAIDLMFRIFCTPGKDNAVSIDPSYGMYQVAAATNDIEFRKVALGNDFSLPQEQLLQHCDQNTKLMFICSPNNPSGNAFSQEEILEVADKFKGILVVDEAYIDFSEKGSMISSIASHPRIVVLQTLSKAWGLAGLRIGLAIAHPYIISLMSMVKYPYNLSCAVQKIALEALENGIEDKVECIKREREAMAQKLKSIACVEEIYPSDANFLLVKTRDADSIYNYLIDKGIIVRNRNKVKLCGNCLRISIGLPEENQQLISYLNQYE